MQTTATISFVNPPKEQGKSGSIKAKDNTLYFVKPADLALFKPGNTYTFEYHTDGKWNVFDRLIEGQAPASTGNGHASGGPADKSEHIFVCGVVNHAIAQGVVNPLHAEQLRMAVTNAHEAWQTVYGDTGPM